MTENKHIKDILACFTKSEQHMNTFFESDAEVFNYKNNTLLFTTDEFSSEDMFRLNNPFQLGQNLAIATLSDILAAGGEPLFYGHAMTIGKDWDEDFVIRVAKGVSSVLAASGVHFLGGDFGIAEHWRYTGTAIGEQKKALSRKGAKPGDVVYMTGRAGAGNLEAALQLYSDHKILNKLTSLYCTQFYSRKEEAKLIREYSSSCIDTSDGVLNGVQTIAEVNACGFHLKQVPLLTESRLAAKLLGKPIELLLMGECGEYELLCTVPYARMSEFEQKVQEQDLVITKIGQMEDAKTRILSVDKDRVDVSGFEISARAFANPKDYLLELTRFINSNKI